MRIQMRVRAGAYKGSAGPLIDRGPAEFIILFVNALPGGGGCPAVYHPVPTSRPCQPSSSRVM